MLSKKIFAAGLAFLASLFERLERVTSDKQIAEMWYRALADLSNEQFQYAVQTLAKTSKFAPTIAEIREKAIEQDNLELTPEEAWAVVYLDIRARGYYNEPHYEDWKLEAAKNAVGWRTLCNMTEDTKPATRAHFMRIYESLRTRGNIAQVTKNENLKQLVGMLSYRLAPEAERPVLLTAEKSRLENEKKGGPRRELGPGDNRIR